MFMRTVLYAYFREQGVVVAPGEAVTLEQVTPEFLQKETACTIRENGREDHPSLMKTGVSAPTVFPDELLAEDPESCAVYNLAISLKDIREKCTKYEVSQFAVMTTYISRAVCSVLSGEESVVLMNVVADMRGVLGSTTTHNCVMTVPVTFSQKEMKNKSEALICTMFRSRLDLGFNRDEALHSCFNSAQMEQRIGGSKAALADAAAQFEQRFGFDRPTAVVTYSHLTHTGFSDSLFELLDDVYINYTAYKMQGKRPIRAIAVVTTDRVINLMLIDGTKNEQILKAIEKRLAEAGVAFETRKLDRYKGILYQG